MKANPNCKVYAMLLLSCCACALVAQSSNVDCGEDVQRIAQKTVDALRANNAHFLLGVVDPAGIVIGVDEPPMSATQFRNDLARKMGVFCVLFDGQTCSRGGFVKSPSSSSLHQLVIRDKVIIKTIRQGMVKGSQIVSAAVSGSRNPKEILFTLYFRCIERRWVLANIDYE